MSPQARTPQKPHVQSPGTSRRPSQEGAARILGQSFGAIDIHFHGAFGIDLMSALPKKLNELSEALWKKGVAGICPTTLSSSKLQLRESVQRLGQWIRQKNHPGARPLGIHLEGPYIHPGACGAHPPQNVRAFDWNELETLWNESLGTLKILTLAPELLAQAEIRKLSQWSKEKKILLSIGHSQATEKQASEAFKNGFTGVTHAWNALPFHQREPGALGAALGKKQIYLELIIDQAHVAPTVLRWTSALHSYSSICFISDCAPPAGLSHKTSKTYTMGELQVHLDQNDSCRLPNGHLAGGGSILTDSYVRWLESEANQQEISISKLFKASVQSLTRAPQRLLGISPRLLQDRRVQWKLNPFKKIEVFPVDSTSRNR